MKRLFIRLLHFVLSCALRAFHLSVKLYSLSFGKTYNLNYLSSSVRFLLKSFFYSVVKDLSPWPAPHLPARLSPFAFRYGSPGFGRRHCRLVGLDGLEPSTSRLSGARSSHLSYKPEFTHGLYDSIIFCLPPSLNSPPRFDPWLVKMVQRVLAADTVGWWR